MFNVMICEFREGTRVDLRRMFVDRVPERYEAIEYAPGKYAAIDNFIWLLGGEEDKGNRTHILGVVIRTEEIRGEWKRQYDETERFEKHKKEKLKKGLTDLINEI